MIKKLKKNLRRLSIPQQIAIGFALTILVGASLLTLPIATNSGESTNFLDALFVATSAVCVTGQTTVNTAAHWNYFGRTVIISLIEIGGLGFMSIIVYFFVFLGKKMTLRQRMLLQETVGTENAVDAQRMIRYIVRFALFVQTLGAGILALDFIPRYGTLKGIYFSFFHSISAFNNAGFDLFGNSLEGFVTNPLVILTIGGLIFFGGLGFIVWRDLLTYRKNKRLLIHTRITLITTCSILIVSFLLFWISETKHGTFAGLSTPDQITNVLFLAITPRTAGYANVNYAFLSPMGIFLTLLLMFIGASSGSTGGGAKVTTFATLFLYLRGQLTDTQPNFKGRAIGVDKIVKAIMILIIGLGMVTVASMILFVTETIPPQFGIEYILMEVFSCFGTVGLTMGLTPDLTAIGKVVLIIVMFAGRIGLLTFFLSLGNHPESREPHIRYPEANILVG
ncbi:Trk family potassium uptake protein [Erysipelothrix sp. HDW6C]|uniref:TrkH family potassium uptake protein n=1 Tax=Erysipelothrix sp. HDW6C TaxID=2714930 RepID=UPI001407B9B6|nr:TrkH family potassium uptake protein [Erysipelothrix sp. HDW6C]QIK69739.1 Trk family potassium uptake protein [Erysipelothrix sp. HDW6C]